MSNYDLCLIPDCESTVFCRGACTAHYYRYYKKSPDMLLDPTSVQEAGRLGGTMWAKNGGKGSFATMSRDRLVEIARKGGSIGRRGKAKR